MSIYEATAKKDNEKIGLLKGQMTEMTKDYENMVRAREEAKKQLEAKFEDVYRHATNTERSNPIEISPYRRKRESTTPSRHSRQSSITNSNRWRRGSRKTLTMKRSMCTLNSTISGAPCRNRKQGEAGKDDCRRKRGKAEADG
jgi:hypothetical protein